MANIAFIIGAPLALLLVIYMSFGENGVLLALLAIAAFYGLKKYLKSDADNKRQALKRAAQHAEENQRANEARRAERALKESRVTQLVDIRANATASFGRVPSSLLAAEEQLDQAEVEFEDGAFAPFWDAVGRAVESLGLADQLFRNISRDGSVYAETCQLVGQPTDGFPVANAEVERLRGLALSTSQRMAGIVRQAQKNFHFATIYEQRKTNQILIAGFTNLGDAIAGLGDRLTDSLGSMSQLLVSLEDGQSRRHAELSDWKEAMTETSRANADAAAAQREAIAGEAAKAAQRQLAMLDNIQRSRRPDPHERGPRKF